jgi:uncharacterized membrane protein
MTDRHVERVLLRLSAMLAVTSAATLAVAMDWDSPIRTMLVLGFLLFVPGLALAALLGVEDLLHRWALATGVSLAVETATGLALLYGGWFSADRVLAIVGTITLAALVVTLVRALGADA